VLTIENNVIIKAFEERFTGVSKLARERKFTAEEIFHETERLLLEVGYEGYNISLLAEALNVSRAAIYKYYTNKEELVVDFMLQHILRMIEAFGKVDNTQPFQDQLEEVLDIVLASKDLHRILSIAHVVDTRGNEEIAGKLVRLSELHREMYIPLYAMVNKGKSEGILNEDIPNELMIAFIFQSIDLPNHMQIPEETFIQSVKQLVRTGIMRTK